MATQLVGNVEQLEALAIDTLREAWRQVFRTSPPKAARKEFLVRILAYEVQQRANRRLSKACTKVLREFESAELLTNSSVAPPTRLRPGARLFRQWGGRDHEVMVMERGYAYRGASYSSLSEIARHITGARWSGPRFFGLKNTLKVAMADESA